MTHFLRELKMYPGEFHIATGGQTRPSRACRRTPDLIEHLEVPSDSVVNFTFDLAGTASEAVRHHFLPAGDRIGTKAADLTAAFLETCRIVAMCQSIRPDGRHVIKACFQHPATNEVVFLSACNNFIGTEARVPAKADGWHICTADMIAPGRFWNMVKERIHA